jgi:hypothetical protein
VLRALLGRCSLTRREAGGQCSLHCILADPAHQPVRQAGRPKETGGIAAFDETVADIPAHRKRCVVQGGLGIVNPERKS